MIDHDLEGACGRSESAGIPVIMKLGEGLPVNHKEMARLIDFLDMHLYRGRYADRAGAGIPGVAVH